MKKYLLSILIVLCHSLLTFSQKTDIGNLVVEGMPLTESNIEERLSQYQNIRSATFSSWDKTGKELFISTRFSEVNQIHQVKTAGGDRKQITFLKEPISQISISPDKSKDGFIYNMDNGGNENYQIYYYDFKTSSRKLLTDGKSRNLFEMWNKDGTKIAYLSNLKNPANSDLYIRNIDNGESELVLEQKGGGWNVADWSKSDGKMILLNQISIAESELFSFDLSTKKLTPLFQNQEKVSYSNATFNKNEDSFFYISDKNSEFNTLRIYNLASKSEKNITSKINWDIEDYKISKDGKTIIFVANEDGYSKMYQLNTQTLTYNVLANIPKGVIGNYGINDNGSQIGLSLSKPNSPFEVYVYDLATQKLVRWTNSELFGLDDKNFSDASIIKFKSFDQREIPSFLYKPTNENKAKLPVLINIHGGPESQAYPFFNPLTQYFCNELKMAVFVPNVRGSSGYGKTYLSLDNAELRENSVRDIGALLDWIKTQPDLDADKVFVYGGSYGGYMCLASMTNYNDRFRGGIDLFGISNFTTFLKNTSPYRVDLRRVEYGDERIPAMAKVFDEISPINKIKNITKPMLIYQGKNDPRVPLSESEQMVDALKKQGNKVWYIMAKDEGHSLAKKANRDFVNKAIIAFIEENSK